MSVLKNKIVDVFSSLLFSAVNQQKVKDSFSKVIQQALEQERQQTQIMLNEYLQNKQNQIEIHRLLDSYLQRPESQWLTDKLLDNYLTRELSQSVINEAIEENKELKKLIWKITNVRPTSADIHWAAIPNSIREQRMIQATIEAGEFVHQHIPELEGKKDAYETLEFALEAVSIAGSYLEFGVFSGATISFIANQVGNSQAVHGFDSFEGLPENWGAAKKGTFNTDGVLPDVPDNVSLHKGWFDQTLPEFLKHNNEPVAFLHADADLYSSTKTILDELTDRLIPGTIIVFDEYFNYPYWREHEYKAFIEFIEKTGKKFEYIAYTDRGYSVAVKIL